MPKGQHPNSQANLKPGSNTKGNPTPGIKIGSHRITMPNQTTAEQLTQLLDNTPRTKRAAKLGELLAQALNP